MQDIAGNTLDAALDLEFLDVVPKIFEDEIGGGDVADYYRFELAENSLVSLLVDNLSQDATLFLRNSDGSREIARSQNSGTVDERLELNLKPDIYFLYVSRTGSGEATPYRLTAQATSLGPTPIDNAGEILDKAKDLGMLGSEPTFATDFIGNFNDLITDSLDYYKFELTENSEIDIRLSGLSENASLFLFNGDLSRELQRSTNSSNVDERITGNFRAGTYYIRVNNGGNGTTYELEASAVSLGPIPADNAGEDRDTARNLGTLVEGGVSISDYIGGFNDLSQDSQDYYQFELAENSTINLKLSDLSENASLQLYNGDGSQRIELSNNAGSAEEIISRNLLAGTYQIRIAGGGNVGTTYQLEASATSLGAIPDDHAGEDIDTAKGLGLLTEEPIIATDYVGNFNDLSQDFQDLYQFDIDENSTISLTLSGLNGDASLQLQNSDRTRTITQSTNTGNADEVITQNLKAGTYYVRVNASSNVSTTYQLSASAVSLGSIPADPAGETIDEAVDLGILTEQAATFNEFIGDFNGLSQDSQDFYRFEVTENSIVDLSVSGLSGDVSLQLFNSDLTRTLTQSNNAGNANETITQNLKAGTYYVRVNAGSSVSTTYQVQASATSLGPIPDDNAGETVETARDLGSIEDSSFSVSDYLGDFNGFSQDSQDYYRFELSESSAVSFTLSQLSESATLTLYNSDLSQTIGNVTGSDTEPATLTQDLNAGFYFLRVNGGTAGTDYQMEGSASPVTIPDNGPFPDAVDIGDLNGASASINDALESGNTTDYYRLVLSENSDLNVSLTGLSANASLALYNAAGNRVLTSSNNAGTVDESINSVLKADTYFLEISGTDTTYQLEASATSLGPIPTDAPGDTFEDATDLGALTTDGITVSDFVGNFNGLNTDSIDYHKFTLNENSSLSLQLTGLSDNASIVLTNGDGTVNLASSNNSGNADELIEGNFRAGSYFVGISRGSSPVGTTYELEASATSLGPIPTDDPGDTFEDAANLGSLTTEGITVSDFIGNFNGLNTDSIDYYKFTLDENSSLSLRLTGLSDNASIVLTNGDGTVNLASSNNSGNADELIEGNFRAGSYFVGISRGSSPVGTTYELEASATSLGPIPTDDPGDTFEDAANLGSLTTEGITVSDFIGNFNGLNTDSIDYYKFTLDENSSLSLRLTGLSDNASIVLTNGDGTVNLTSSNNSGNADEVIEGNFRAGSYFVGISRGSSPVGTTYELEASATSLGPIPTDDPGDTFEDAANLGSLTTEGITVSDFIGNFNGLNTDSIDYYKFTLDENSSLSLRLTGLSDNASIVLTNGDGTVNLTSSNNSGNADEVIEGNFRAGSYFVGISRGSSPVGTTYELEASATSLGPIPEDIAGEVDYKAKDLGILNSDPIAFDDFIGDFNGLSNDNIDYYRFKLSENSEVTLNLDGLSENASLTLYNSDFSQALTSSNNGGNSDEEIIQNLKAGSYFFAITSNSSVGTNYRIQASADSLGVYEDSAGDTLATARDIGVLDDSRTFEDYIGNFFDIVQDGIDLYKFELKEISTVSLALNRLNNDASASIQLLDEQGSFIESANGNTLNTSLTAGIYYFQIRSTSNEGTRYTLTATGAPILDLAGNTLGQARDIGNLDGSRTFTDYIGDVDRDDFYRFDLASDSSVNLSVSPELLGQLVLIGLFDRQGNLVESFNGDISTDLEAGSYYAQVIGGDTYYDVAFSAIPDAVGPFQIEAVTPVEGSNVGQTTITVTGSQFTSAAQVSIIDAAGTEFVADKVGVQSESSLTATFNLVGLTSGAYDVKVVDAAGTATANDLFNVTTGTPGKLDVFISAPSALRPWSTGEVVVTYRNSGESDITAPLLTLNAEGANFEEDGEYADGTVQFLAINKEGDAGVLPPGATGTYSVKFRPNPGANNIDFTVNSLATGETVDWNAIEESSRPENIPVETWDVIFQNFTDEVGDLAGEYEKVLAENASRLSELGEYTGDVSRLLSFELQQGNSQAIFERFTDGSFGRGWNNPWDVTATENSDGDVVIANGGSLRFFERQANGTYLGDDGDAATLTEDGGSFQLREEDGTVIDFLANGKLAAITDTNGNEVVAGYSGDNLTTLTYSNGDVVGFAYNAAGKVSEVTDPFGQKTTYTYDAAGERLLSVTDESGTVSYTYETEGAKANAIKSITFPDGTQTLYEYDDQGRVTKESRNGVEETVTYTYDSVGKVTVTDAEGHTAELFQNADGQVSRTVDALGRTTEFRYDDAGNLTRIAAPNGDVSTFNYDSRGNLLSSTDPLGQQVSFTYDSEFNQIQTVRDQRGNSITYSYDDTGNLDGIVYADGSGETYRYNEDGDVTVSINRRGQAINYSYDERGLLTKKAFADGTEATFDYDERGNLTQAVDADSSVTYAYDSANRLTKVTYDTGRFLEFDYDAGGRRSRMVDQDGFTTNYLYDEVGRLEQLTDKDDANVITYSYDAVGRLAREDNGNGTYTTYDYDTAGQLLSIVNYQPDGDINSRYDYTYDELGQRTSMTTLEGTTSYGYDETGQLISVELPNGREIVYEYDAAGNRISVTDDGVRTDYTTNNLNQYTTVGDAVYTYDTDGNLISKVEGDDTWTYSYDIENRLIGVTTPDGTWAYEYDALGSRIASVEGSERKEYLVDPIGLGNLVGEYSQTESNRYMHALGLVSQNGKNNESNYYDLDAVGSVIGLADANGNYLNRYAYLPFGERITEVKSVLNPFEFIGQFGVTDEGNGLDYMRARFYTSTDGRFISTDPIGIGGGTNLYAYAKNSPANLIDPEGKTAIAVVGAPVIGILAIGYLAYLAINPTARETLGEALQQTAESAQRAVREATKASPKIVPSPSPNPDPNPNPNPNPDQNPDPKPVPAPEPEPGDDGDDFDPWEFPKTPRRRKNPFPGWEEWAEDNNPGIEDITPPGDEKANEESNVARSIDPNDILGPSGFGPLNYITPDQTLPYTIRFENQASATAPAVFVTITQTLDADLDLSTFELGDFGFGDIYIDVPEGFQTYSQRLDLRDTLGDYVDFEASLNKETGEVLWTLTTIDDETGNIPDAVDAGFLPPNNDNHDGEGFVTYRINAKPDLPTGTRLDAEASIVFDTNEAIETPPIFNTLDVGTPSSQVTAFSGTTFPTFDVSWSGTDDGSGIATYDIYVSVDGGDYELWLNDTADTTATYTGEAGRTYQFYSVAKDNVGYTEDAPRTADAIATPVEPIATVVATSFDVTNDHVNTGQANITFTLANQGTTTANNISASIIYSNDDIIGNEDDLTVETLYIGDLASGEEIDQSLSVQLPRELLNSRAQADDVTGLGNGYVSSSYDYVGILINPDFESNSTLDAAAQKGISSDDITYFPWDIDGNGLVTPTDAIFVINRLGQSTPDVDVRADFDGNGLITPTDAISSINRLGYSINNSVFE